MKRSPPPKRKAPLRAGKPLARKTPIKRTAAPRKATGEAPARPRERRTPNPATVIPPASRRAVVARSGGRCERCLRRRAVHMHHRLARRHRDHSPENLAHLCAVCHGEVHASPEESYAAGWMIRSTS